MNTDPSKGLVRLRDIPDPKYPPFVIENIVHDVFTVLYARPEAGKGWLALSLASSLVTGEAWLGSYRVRETHNVAFWTLDGGGSNEIKRRMREHYPELQDMLVYSGRDWCEDYELAAKQLLAEQVDFLIIDNLQRLTPRGRSVRDDDAAETVLRDLQVFINHGITVVLLHHSGKPGEDGSPRTTPLGATAIESYARHFIRIDRDPSNPTVRNVTSYGNDLECPEVRISFMIKDSKVVECRSSDADRMKIILEGQPWENQKAIADKLGIGQAMVSRIMRRSGYRLDRKSGQVNKVAE